MEEWLRVILAGVAISLTGSLPLGNLNVTATHIAAKENTKVALWFALGAALVEMLYLRLTLALMDVILIQSSLFQQLQWVTVVLLLALAGGSFWALRKADKGEIKNVLLDNQMNRFVLGLLMSLVNPAQLPFWAGWVSYLLTQHWISDNTFSYNLFTIAAGMGTLLAMLLFILAGRKLSTTLHRHQRKVHGVMGALFLGMALWQIHHLLP